MEQVADRPEAVSTLRTVGQQMWAAIHDLTLGDREPGGATPHLEAERLAIQSLTERELEIMRLVAQGLDSQRIARRLYISERTERNHVANILAKLGVHSRLEALIACLRHAVVDLQ
jgi:DNA-binding NarL/FixJ family response regulator